MPYDIEGDYIEFDDMLAAQGYEFKFEYGMYGYEWDETHVYMKDNRVFTLKDSGCSCFVFGDGWVDVQDAVGDMREVTKLPSLGDLALEMHEEGEYVHWDESFETIQGKYRELGLR